MKLSDKTQRLVDRAIKAMEKESPIYNVQINSCDNAERYCRMKIGSSENEKFLVLFLTSQHELISGEIMFSGTVNAASVFTREIVKRGLELNAAAMILSHNHPSGHPEPSGADYRITTQIKEACSLVDISVLDHLVVTADSYVSMAQRGTF